MPAASRNPAVWEPIVAERAIENELIARGLGHRGSRGQLIEKEDAFPACREEIRSDPFRPVILDAWQSPEIDGIELDGAHVNKVALQLLRDLLNELGFADAAGAPDMDATS